MQQKQRLGKFGEDLACQFLIRHDYIIVERNYHTQDGEIDIVATKSGEFYFIEVKTRSTLNSGYPEESFDEIKKQRFELAVADYLDKKDLLIDSWQMGLISIVLVKNLVKIKFSII